MEKETKEKEVKNDYTFVKIPTGEALAIQDKDGNVLMLEEAVLYLLNEVSKLKKVVG